MECNRDEALRAKEIAEKKLASEDYHGALKFLQKALQLFPGLENASQISAVLDVHIAAQEKINGTEMDWYGILQIDLKAEDIVIKKQYKKLALLLHPDKNKFAGAEAAFKLIGEALQVLSDKTKRSLYDAKRRPVGNTNNRNHSRQTSSYSHATKQSTIPETFLTTCPSCLTRYQYHRVYINQTIICPQCRIPFLAEEYHTGVNSTHGWQHFTQQQNSYRPSASAKRFPPNFDYFNPDPTHAAATKTGVGLSDNGNHMSKESAKVEQTAQGMKRKRSEEKEVEKEMRRMEKERQKKAKADQRAQELLEKERKKQKAPGKDKKRHSRKHSLDSSDDNDDVDNGDENCFGSEPSDYVLGDQVMKNDSNRKGAPRRSSRPRRNVTYKVDVSDDDEDYPGGSEETQETETTNVGPWDCEGKNKGSPGLKKKQKLADSNKSRLRKDLNLQNAKHFTVNEDDSCCMKATGKQGEGSTDHGTYQVDGARQEPEDSKDVQAESHPDGHMKQDTVADDGDGDSDEELDDESDEEEQNKKYSVPDPDFHNFDQDREENHVQAGQIWATYDELDGLPRFYFKVKELLSQSPFRVRICWLELRNLSKEQQALKRLGFSPSCGYGFRFGKTQVFDSVGMFSHILKWEKGPKGLIRIVPRKGDIWAVFSNWRPGDGLKKEDLLQKYDMVEVLTDFSEQSGVSVAPLEKVPSFTTVFKTVDSHEAVIPAVELCRFSYQVPAYKLLGNEGPDCPEGCWDLDPAALPMNLVSPSSCNGEQ